MNTLTLNEVIDRCPAVLAEDAHESRSRRYGFVPTMPVLLALYDAGFVATEARQTGSRARAQHGKHLVRLSLVKDLDGIESAPGGLVPQVLLRNSHDGTSSLFLAGGLLRYACFNGLVIGEVWAQRTMRHTRQLVQEAIESTFEIINRARSTQEQALAWQGVEFDDEARQEYAKLAMRLRMGDRRGWDPGALLEARRPEDEASNLWTAYNRAQENGTKGGFHGQTARGTQQTARAITQIEREVAFNRNLWRVSAEWARGGLEAALVQARAALGETLEVA
jgi:hypothetical protein